MIWFFLRKPKPTQTTLDDVLDAIQTIRKELKMDFTQLTAAIAQLGVDVGAEVDAAKAAILAAQAGDPTALAAAVTAINNIDAAVKAAATGFTPVTSTGTDVPPPPAV